MLFRRIRVVAAVAMVILTVVTVKTATAAQPSGVTGVITQVGSDGVTIKLGNGQTPTIKVNNATVVKVDGKAVKLADLKAGMSTMVIGEHLSQGNPAKEIRAYTGQHGTSQPAHTGGVTGTITQVGSGSITIKLSNGHVAEIKFNDATVVNVNGQAAKATDLKVGMRTAITGEHLSLGNPAKEIRAYMPK